jgi:hypothetical protein
VRENCLGRARPLTACGFMDRNDSERSYSRDYRDQRKEPKLDAHHSRGGASSASRLEEALAPCSTLVLRGLSSKTSEDGICSCWSFAVQQLLIVLLPFEDCMHPGQCFDKGLLAEVAAALSVYGSVSSVRLAKDRETGHAR